MIIRVGAGLLSVLFMLLLAVGTGAGAAERLQVLEVQGQLERAGGPVELIGLASEGRTTVRALRAFGRLPDEFGALALALRGAGVDLLAAGVPEVEALVAEAEAGRLAADAQALQRLLAVLEDREYLDWHPLLPGEDPDLAEDDLLRGTGRAVLRRASGATAALELSGAPQQALAAMGPVREETSPREYEREYALPATKISGPARALGESLTSLFQMPGSPLFLGGDLEFVERADGKVRVTLPFLSMRVPVSPDGESDWVELDLGTVIADLRPLGPERWEVSVSVPAVVNARDADGDLVGRMTLGERSLTGVWAEDLTTMLKLDLHLEDLALEFGLESPLAVLAPGADSMAAPAPAPVREPASDPPVRLAVQGVSVTLDLDEQQPGVVRGPLELVLNGISLEAPNGAPQGRLGRFTLGADYQDVDLAALARFGEFAADPETLMERDPAELLAEILTALGAFQTRMELSDLAVEAPPGEHGHLRLAHVAVDTGFKPSQVGELKRDLWGSLEARGLSFETEELAFDLDAFDWNLRLDRIAPMTLLRLGLGSMMTGEFSEAEALASAQEILGGFGFGLSLAGASGRAEYLGDGPPVGLEQFEFGLGLSDLDTLAPGIALTYRHRGVAGLPMAMIPVSEALLPRELVLDLAASRLPAAFLAEEGRMASLGSVGADSAQEGFEALLASATRLDINEFVIDLPMGGLRFKGNGRVEAGDAPEPAILRTDSELEIRNLAALIEMALELSSPEARQQIVATTTMLKLLGEERRTDAGEVVHYYRIEASSQGELLVNGNDLAPMLMSGGG